MARGKKVLTVMALLAVITVGGWALIIGAVYAWGGVATVRVQDSNDGINLYVPVPMAVVNAAVSTGRMVVPDEDWLDIQAEMDLGEWQPMVREILAALDDCPDAVLVKVEGPDEHVIVEKRGRKLYVSVDADDISVRVSVPTRAVQRTVSKLIG